MKDLKLLGTAEKQFYGTFNDIGYSNGDFKTLEGNPRVKQGVSKILITRQGSLTSFILYGATLKNFIFTNIFGEETRQGVINAVVQALSYYNTLETSTDPSELIDTIDALDFSQDSKDPRKTYIKLAITLKDGSKITITMEE